MNKEKKKCNACYRELPLECFYPNKKSKDGFWHICKECKDGDKKKMSPEIPESVVVQIIDKSLEAPVEPLKNLSEKQVEEKINQIINTNLADMFYFDGKSFSIKPVQNMPSIFPFFLSKITVNYRGALTGIELDTSLQKELLLAMAKKNGLLGDKEGETDVNLEKILNKATKRPKAKTKKGGGKK